MIFGYVFLSKLADWDSSDDDDARAKPSTSKARTVLLKYMFAPEDIDKDPALLLDLKDDVREECESLGEVTNVVLYDVSTEWLVSSGSSHLVIIKLEPEGIMTVKFKDNVSAQACVIVRRPLVPREFDDADNHHE